MLGMPLEFRAVTRMQPLITLYHRRHARFGGGLDLAATWRSVPCSVDEIVNLAVLQPRNPTASQRFFRSDEVGKLIP